MSIENSWNDKSEDEKEDLISEALDALDEEESATIIRLGLNDSDEEIVQTTIEELQGIDDEELDLFISDLLKLLHKDEDIAEQVEFLLEDTEVTVDHLKKADLYDKSEKIDLDGEEERYLEMLKEAVISYNNQEKPAETLAFYLNPENGYINISISNDSETNAPDMSSFGIVQYSYEDWYDIYYESPAPIVVSNGKEFPIISKANEIFEKPFNSFFESLIRKDSVKEILKDLNRSESFQYGFQFLDSVYKELISLS